MKIESIRALSGPNVYSYRPVLLMRLDLGELNERESCEFSGFNERLLAILPGIQNHHCSFGRPGGFVTRLDEGTYFGHIVEHVALELTELAGVGKSHGKTRHDCGTIYHVAIEYQAKQASTYLLEQAVKLVEALLRNKSFYVAPVVKKRNNSLTTPKLVQPHARLLTQQRNATSRADETVLAIVFSSDGESTCATFKRR